MNRVIKNKILNAEYSQRKIFCYLVVLIVVFSGLYIYFVNKAVVNVVDRGKIERDILSINSNISDLESQYLILSSGLSFDYALSRGFVKITKEKYVSRKALSLNLSKN